MARPMTLQERVPLMISPTAMVIVTDDDQARLARLNCFGFFLGIPRILLIDPDHDAPGPGQPASPRAFLERLGFQERRPLAGTEQGFALYRQNHPYMWHVAKHLRDGCFESKCALNKLGNMYFHRQFIHRADCFLEDGYGSKPDSYWEATDRVNGMVLAVTGRSLDEWLRSSDRVADSAMDLDRLRTSGMLV